jgi:hypothetical protein
MISGHKEENLSDDEIKRIEEIIKNRRGTLGPGCCIFDASGIKYIISNVGDRATCDHLVQSFEGRLISYVQGRDC